MKFTFEIDDSWMDETYLSEALTVELQRQCVAAILNRLDDRIQKEIAQKVAETVEAMIVPRIEGMLTEFVNEGNIIRNNQQIAVVDYLREMFQKNSGWNSPGEQIAALAKKFGAELKMRYDAAFANQIVVRINENGMLKDDVVKMLTQ